MSGYSGRSGSSSQNENRDARNAARAAGLNDYQSDKFHERLSSDPLSKTYSFAQLVDIANDVKRLHSGYRRGQ